MQRGRWRMPRTGHVRPGGRGGGDGRQTKPGSCARLLGGGSSSGKAPGGGKARAAGGRAGSSRSGGGGSGSGDGGGQARPGGRCRRGNGRPLTGSGCSRGGGNSGAISMRQRGGQTERGGGRRGGRPVGGWQRGAGGRTSLGIPIGEVGPGQAELRTTIEVSRAGSSPRRTVRARPMRLASHSPAPLPRRQSIQRGRQLCVSMLTACPGRFEGTLLYTPIPASGGTLSGHGPGSVFLYTPLSCPPRHRHACCVLPWRRVGAQSLSSAGLGDNGGRQLVVSQRCFTHGKMAAVASAGPDAATATPADGGPAIAAVAACSLPLPLTMSPPTGPGLDSLLPAVAWIVVACRGTRERRVASRAAPPPPPPRRPPLSPWRRRNVPLAPRRRGYPDASRRCRGFRRAAAATLHAGAAAASLVRRHEVGRGGRKGAGAATPPQRRSGQRGLPRQRLCLSRLCSHVARAGGRATPPLYAASLRAARGRVDRRLVTPAAVGCRRRR